MTYSNPLRRRARQLRRLAAAATRPPMWRGGVVVPALWWDGHPNFGDDITPWLLPEYGILPVHRIGRSRATGRRRQRPRVPARGLRRRVWGSGLMPASRTPCRERTCSPCAGI